MSKSSRPPRRVSGKLAAVDPAAIEAMRAKMDSIMENTIPLMDKSIEALEQAITTSQIPPASSAAIPPVPRPSSPGFLDIESETTPVPTTKPSPSAQDRAAREATPIDVESDPFGSKKT